MVSTHLITHTRTPKGPGARGPVPRPPRPARPGLPAGLPSPRRPGLPAGPPRGAEAGRTCWSSSSVSGCWRPSSFMGKLVCGSSTVSRYLPSLALCGWLLAPATERTTSPRGAPRHPGRQGRRRGGLHRFQAAARAPGPGPRGRSPQRMPGRPQAPGDRRGLGSHPGSGNRDSSNTSRAERECARARGTEGLGAQPSRS